MVEATAPEQSLWEYDVDVVRRGTFSIMAKSLEEAETVVNNMDEDELESKARWFSCEGEVSC
jgi:hypothetical protein